MFAIGMLLMWQLAYGGQLFDRIMEYRAAQQGEDSEDGESSDSVALPAGARLMRDVPYGKNARQSIDIYLPQQAAGAPVIFMVHGGAWRADDKRAKAVVENKMARWVAKGFIFISVNYRLLPETAPMEQAEDIALALATAQAQAASWGGDPAKFILMGHSAGAHLVSLLAASPDKAYRWGVKPWLGTVALDSAAFDVAEIMSVRHAPLYDSAFGSDAAYWKEASPFYALSAAAAPMLAVCSTQRGDSCAQAVRFAGRARSLNVQITVLRQELSHRDINRQLGVEGAYTDAVEAFMAGLDDSVRRMLATHAGNALQA
ncbi:hypothetical protein CAP31_02705 [Sulfuriferula sp. AH1]|nr:hypothetical protein CAP31_02705 [Sulfuriferula sp. AH1]